MKKANLFPIILFFVFTIQICAQNSVPQTTRQDCSGAVRPIIKILSSGVVIGRIFRIVQPQMNDSARKFAQNALVNVKIEIDEDGKVIYAKADSKIPILQSLSEKAAQQTRFSPTMVDGFSIKIKGQITYKFIQGEVKISYNLDPVKYKPLSPLDRDYEFRKRFRMFGSEIVSAIYDFRAGKSLDSYAFIKNDQANIQLCMTTKTVEIVEIIKQTGFELLEETPSNGLVGRIVVENLEKLADIEQIRFILPEMPQK